MKKFVAKSLEEAFQQASEEFNCSIIHIEYEVLQHPKNGLLGFFKKEAIIYASPKQKKEQESPKEKSSKQPEQQKPVEKERVKKEYQHQVPPKKERDERAQPLKEQTREQESKPKSKIEPKINYHAAEKDIIDNFYVKGANDLNVALEVEDEIKRLFSHICFELDSIKVEQYDDSTLYIEFSGKDAALLIGKEGYRYKALSYMLFNWINAKYGMMIRLEIAEFLQNQEEMIRNYLKPVIATVQKEGKATTRSLDGVLVHIALKQLREEFPNKYVAIKINSENERYIVINDFYKQ